MSESVALLAQIDQAPNTGKCHVSESVKHVAQIDRTETRLTTSCPPADARNGKIQWVVVQISIFKKMKHDAMDDDEKDDSNDGNANCMKNYELQNVLQILDRTLPEPWFRDSADQIRLAGTMESDPLEARSDAS